MLVCRLIKRVCVSSGCPTGACVRVGWRGRWVTSEGDGERRYTGGVYELSVCVSGGTWVGVDLSLTVWPANGGC